MMPIQDLLNKIKWSKIENPDEYKIVYLDRVVGKGIEIDFTAIKNWEGTFMTVQTPLGESHIPMHRIKIVKKNNEIVWQREKIEIKQEEDLSAEKVATYLGTAKKNIRYFNETTPKGNKIEGWIVISRGSRMGSLLIEKANEKKTLQYVTGMPKIHYNDEMKWDLNTFENIRLLEKLDGTNIVFFPLIVEGKVIEVCTKTRLMPLTQEQWKSYIEEMIKKYPQIPEAVEKEKVSISTELYGYRNAHGINYKVLGISLDMAVFAILDKGMALPSNEIKRIADKYDLPFASKINDKKYLDNYKDYIPERHMIKDANELYVYLEGWFENMNNKYYEKYPEDGGIIAEGCVWHMDKNGETFMLKNKATTVKETHIQIASGIQPIFIRQAIQKVFENQPRKVFENEEKTIGLIKEELKEDFIEDVIEDKKSIVRIEKAYADFLFHQKGLDEFKEVAKKIELEVGKDADISVKLRKFAEMYPKFKKNSNIMFRIFSKQV